MSIVKEHIAHIEAMKNSVEDVVREILIENQSKIVELVKYDQLAKGLNSKDTPLKWGGGDGFYAPSTQGHYDRDFGKSRVGYSIPKTVGDPYNFQWTSETFDNMGFKLTSKSYEVFTVQHKMALFQRLGYGDIFSLTELHNQYINEQILQPELIKWIDENWWRLIT